MSTAEKSCPVQHLLKGQVSGKTAKQFYLFIGEYCCIVNTIKRSKSVSETVFYPEFKPKSMKKALLSLAFCFAIAGTISAQTLQKNPPAASQQTPVNQKLARVPKFKKVAIMNQKKAIPFLIVGEDMKAEQKVASKKH